MLLASLLISLPLGLVYSFVVAPHVASADYSPAVGAVVSVVAFFIAGLLSCAVLGIILRPKAAQPRAISGRSRGRVKWFDVSKGFGFITKDDGSDVFVHVREIKGPRRRLREGERVSFVVTKGKRGPQAQDVKSEERRDKAD